MAKAIPKHIRNKMHRVAKLIAEASEEMQNIEAWLQEHGYDIDALRCGDGCSLEELDYGNDITEELCLRLENGFGLSEEQEAQM